MSNITSYEANKHLIDNFSRRVFRRLCAAGTRGVELSDIVQELSIAWMTAVRCYKPERQVPFGPYLMLGMRNHINRWAQHEIGASHLAPLSLDKEMSDDSDNDIHQNIPSGDMRIDDRLIEKDLLNKILNTLSPRARQFVELLSEPPEEVVQISNARIAKSEYIRKLGGKVFVSRTISQALIFDLMGAAPIERNEIRQEIEDRSKGWNSDD